MPTRSGVLVTIWTLVSLAILLFIARLRAHWLLFNRFPSNNAFSFIGLLSSLVLVIFFTLILAVYLPTPNTISQIDIQNYQFALTCLYFSSLWAVKASLLSMFYTMTDKMEMARKGFWIITSVLLATWALNFFCYPISPTCPFGTFY
jgi:hypothetical protein